MAIAQQLHTNASIAIYDDDEISRESTADNVYDAGYKPVLIEEPILNIDDCVRYLLNYDAVLIDHRLSGGNFGNYTGAEVVKRLYPNKKPALLITAWSEGDPEALQPYNRYLVNVIKKGKEDELNQIKKGFETCVNEMNNIYLPERRPTRTIIIIASSFDSQDDLNRVNVFIPSWNPNEGVTFPVDIIPKELRPYLKADQCFFANVNTGAESQDELFFENFELAPDPD